MNQSKRMDRNERIGAALRRGDPATEETGLSLAETQAMRRAVLSAVETATEPRRVFGWAPAFAAGAVAVLSLAVGLSLWRMRGPEPVVPVAAVAAPAASSPAVPPVFASPTAVAVVLPPPAHPARHRERARRTRVAEPDVPAAPPSPADAPTRQVQFSAPGGTRIIWLLHETAP